MGPDYVQPDPTLAVPDDWKKSVMKDLEPVADASSTTPLEAWWTAFNDPKLTDLIERAALSNLSLRVAAARVAEARALLGVAYGRYYPDGFADASVSGQQPSDNGLIPPPAGQSFSSTALYEIGVGMSWEIDLFGRVRRQVESARAGLEASIEDYRDVLVVLLADVAANYVDLRTLQLRIEYARQNVEAQQGTLQLTRDRFDAGLTSARDVAQAESNLASSQSTIPSLETALEASVNRLAVLLGSPPGEVDALLDDPPVIPTPDGRVVEGMPADLLRRRPDIRRAERELAAQTAIVGVATADLYPSLSLTGFLGLQSTSSGSLTSSNSVTWSLIPGLRLNLFNRGRIRSQIKVEEARTEQFLLNWEGTVLEALAEVENAMVAGAREKVRRDRLMEAVDATERTVELVRTQYLSGLTDFQSYLDSQRSLISQQDLLAESEGLVVLNTITLNRALGGGWTPPPPPDDPDPKEVAREIAEQTPDSGREP